MMKFAFPALLFTVAATSALRVAAEATPPVPAPTVAKISVTYKDARTEEALAEALTITKGELSVLCDSYTADTQRATRSASTETADALMPLIAKDFDRQLLRLNGRYLVRHDRWFDLAFAANPGSPEQRKLPRQCALRKESSSKNSLITGDFTRATLPEVAKELQRLTGQKHSVVLPLGKRRVSGHLSEISAEECRAFLTALYPDSQWVKRGLTWWFVERPEAALIRQIAADGAEKDMDQLKPLTALSAQVASELTPDQWHALSANGELRIGWAQLSSTGRDLMRQRANMFLEIVDRGNGSRDMFIDFSRMQDWGLQITFTPEGNLRGVMYGPTPSGPTAYY